MQWTDEILISSEKKVTTARCCQYRKSCTSYCSICSYNMKHTFSVSCQTLFLEKFCQDCVELALLQHIFTMFLALQITTHSQCHVCTRLFRYDNNESAGKSDWGERKGKKTRGSCGSKFSDALAWLANISVHCSGRKKTIKHPWKTTGMVLYLLIFYLFYKIKSYNSFMMIMASII